VAKKGSSTDEELEELEAAFTGEFNARVSAVIAKAVAKSKQRLVDDIIEGLRDIKL
jgi:hypothetical protein